MSSPDQRQFRAMATDVNVRLVAGGPQAEVALAAAEELFARVERACTRFDPNSPLMRANAQPRRWHSVPPELFAAVRAAARAHAVTDGRFDPRVLTALQQLGYSVTFTQVADDDTAPTPVQTRGERTWRPGLDRVRRRVRIGPVPIDLGGIGKGLAVTRAAALLAPHAESVLVEAGGDVQVVGSGPERAGWQVGIEDPSGGPEPVAVVRLVDGAVATSSIRLRQWRQGGRRVHHLVDPRTGLPAESGLLAVSVVDGDCAAAEVWSKALFVEGRGGLRAYADERQIAALWVDDQGWVGTSRAMKPFVIWQREGRHALTAGR